jgi:hypothetical protein
MKVLIVGQAKTGSTALLFALKQALAIEHMVSEPERLGFEDEYDDLIVKYFDRGRDREHIGKYDKVVILVRNGYDTLTSQLLFQPRAHLRKKTDRELRRYIGKVRDVREGRAGIVELSQCFEQMTGIDLVAAVAARQQHLVTLKAETEGKSQVLRYEDFMRGDLAALERYFGIAISAGPEVTLPQNLSYVSRSRRVENWRGWISPEDMDALASRFKAFHDAFGYRFDRGLLRTIKIDASEGEDHVWRTVRQRQRRGGRLWRVKLIYKRLRRAVRERPAAAAQSGGSEDED